MLQDALRTITPPFDFGTAIMFMQEGFRVKRLKWDEQNVARWIGMSGDGIALGICNPASAPEETRPLVVIPVSDIVSADWVLVPE